MSNQQVTVQAQIAELREKARRMFAAAGSLSVKGLNSLIVEARQQGVVVGFTIEIQGFDEDSKAVMCTIVPNDDPISAALAETDAKGKGALVAIRPQQGGALASDRSKATAKAPDQRAESRLARALALTEGKAIEASEARPN